MIKVICHGSTFDQVKLNKSYLFVAWGESETKKLFELAETDIKLKMWHKIAKEKDTIGQYGYAITDDHLLQRLSDKYQSFTNGEPYDVNKKITDLIVIVDPLRNTLSG